MTWLAGFVGWDYDALRWSGWGGIQGLAALLGLASIIVYFLNRRDRVRALAFPGVGFDVARSDAESGAHEQTVTMTARRGAVLYDVAFMMWAPMGSALPDEEGFRPRWDHGDGEYAMRFALDPTDQALFPRVRAGVVGFQHTSSGGRLFAQRIGLNPDSVVEEWVRYRLPARLRADGRRGRWRTIAIPRRRVDQGPWFDLDLPKLGAQ